MVCCLMALGRYACSLQKRSGNLQKVNNKAD
jgi:hypothetical protein